MEIRIRVVCDLEWVVRYLFVSPTVCEIIRIPKLSRELMLVGKLL